MPWVTTTHDRSASNPKELLHRLSLGRVDYNTWCTVYLYEQLEGENNRAGRRFWLMIHDPVRHTSKRFGGTLKAAKRRALQTLLKLVHRLHLGLRRLQSRAVREANSKEIRPCRRKAKS